MSIEEFLALEKRVTSAIWGIDYRLCHKEKTDNHRSISDYKKARFFENGCYSKIKTVLTEEEEEEIFNAALENGFCYLVYARYDYSIAVRKSNWGSAMFELVSERTNLRAFGGTMIDLYQNLEAIIQSLAEETIGEQDIQFFNLLRDDDKVLLRRFRELTETNRNALLEEGTALIKEHSAWYFNEQRMIELLEKFGG